MKQRTMSRWAVARRLQALALGIAAGKTVRVRGVAVRVPDQLVLEEDVEAEDGEIEIELELRWPAVATAPERTPSGGRQRRRRRSGAR